VADDVLRDRSREAFDQAAKDLRELPLSGPAKHVAKAMIGVLRRHDHDAVLAAVDGWRLDLRRIDGILADVGDKVATAEAEQARIEPLGAAWWSKETAAVMRARRTRSLGGATERWATTWILGLGAEQWDRCDSLLSLPEATEGERDLAIAMQEVTDALRDSTDIWRVTLPTRELLDDPGQLGVEGAVKLGVLRARALVGWWADLPAALAAAESAARLADEAGHAAKRLGALAQAAVAEVLLAQGRHDAARRRIDRSMAVEEAGPDALLAAAALAEADGSWAYADDLYAEAIARAESDLAVAEGIDLTKPQLLRPVPARLLWRCARTRNDADPVAALALLDRALEQGVPGEMPHPERHVMLDRAEVLERLHRTAEAGRAYFQAGNAFVWSGSSGQGLELLGTSCELAPDVAEHRWAYAEALRAHVVDADGIVDELVMARITEQLAAGARLGTPDADHAWVRLTEASVADLRADPEADPILLCERALMLNPEYALSYGFLADLLRRHGLPRQALLVAEQGLTLSADPLVAFQHVSALIDLGRYEEALAEVDGYLVAWPNDADLLIRKAIALIRLEKPEAALATLADLDDERSPSLRAICRTRLGDEQSAQAEYQTIWLNRRSAVTRAFAAWAAYRIGALEDAAELLTELVERSQASTSHGRDLGQVLLADGRLDDGERLLRDGIEETLLVDDLVHLTEAEFPVLVRAVADRPYGGRVAAMVNEFAARADERVVELRSAARSTATPAELAGQARIAMRTGQYDAAAGAYERLLPAVPEAGLGLRRALQAIQARGDRNLRGAEDLAGARADWQRVLQAADLLGAADDVILGARARLAFADLESTGIRPSPELLTELAGADSSMLHATVDLFARDVGSWWSHRDALTAMAADPALRQHVRAEFERIAGELTLEDVYLLKRSWLPESETFPVVTALEVRLGGGLSELVGSRLLHRGIARLRDELAAEMGVRIPLPGCPPPPPGDSDTTVRLLVHEQEVKVFATSDDLGMANAAVLNGLEEVVREHLFRLIAPDDLGLWLAGWDSSVSSAALWQPTTAAARLRLMRVLRLLLREGVPVVDRELIASVCRDCEAAAMPGTPMAAVRAVRCRLGAEWLGWFPGARVHRLPADLLSRAASGLAADGSYRWELPRPDANALLTDLRAWLGSVAPPDEPVALVSVDDARLRPFLWRLLAAEPRPVRVFADEELP